MRAAQHAPRRTTILVKSSPNRALSHPIRSAPNAGPPPAPTHAACHTASDQTALAPATATGPAPGSQTTAPADTTRPTPAETQNPPPEQPTATPRRPQPQHDLAPPCTTPAAAPPPSPAAPPSETAPARPPGPPRYSDAPARVISITCHFSVFWHSMIRPRARVRRVADRQPVAVLPRHHPLRRVPERRRHPHALVEHDQHMLLMPALKPAPIPRRIAHREMVRDCSPSAAPSAAAPPAGPPAAAPAPPSTGYRAPAARSAPS